MSERLVVVGGDAAGMSAASQARRRRGPDDLEIVALERGSDTSYSACGIPYWIGGAVADRDALVVRRPEVFRERQAIDVRIGHEVVDVDTGRAEVTVVDLDGGTEQTVGYDRLLLATGANPTRPGLPGGDADGILGVQTLDDGEEILGWLDRREPERAVIVGGGYIGLEMAEALLERGLDVSLVEAAPQPMSTLDPDMGALVADALRDHGVRLHLDCPVRGFVADGRGRVAAVDTAAGELPADVVVLGLGTTPAVELAEAAGIPVGEAGGIVTDRRQRTAVEGVWAAGDCTETFHRIARRPVAYALGTIANKQGRVAGVNLGGGYATFPGVVGTAVTRVCDTEIARTGLNETEAGRAGLAWVSERFDSNARAGYLPAAPLTMKVLAERGTGRLLGAQIVGTQGAAKRIDVLATALWNDMRVDDLLNVDLGYAPPYAPVWDPVLVGARKAARAVGEGG